MREKLLLLASIAFLIGSANHAVFVERSIAQTVPSASHIRFFAADLQSSGDHAVAPQRRVLVQLAQQRKSGQTVTTPSLPLVHYRQRQTVQRQPTRSPRRKRQPSAQPNRAPTPTPAPKPAPAPPPMHPAIDKAGIKIHHRVMADEIMKMLPEQCRDNLRNFYVRYDDMEGRGLGGKSTIILNGNVSDSEFRALFVHELGHVIDLGCLQGSPRSGSTRYRDGDDMMYADDPSLSFYRISWISSHTQRRGVHDDDFVSGYASWDMFEDFAESFAYYFLHRQEFVERAQHNDALAAKLAWFRKHLPNTQGTAVSHHQWNQSVPWDVTKLGYAWGSE